MGTGILTRYNWSERELALLAAAAWYASGEVRSTSCHRTHSCPTRRIPYAEQDPHAQRIDPRCETSGCLDLLHDLLERMLAKISRHRELHPDTTIENLGGFARKVAATELVELQRRQRAARGFPARPGRNDGVAARINERLTALGGAQGEWLVVLFRVLRSYPYSTTHVPGRWPLEGLLIERAQHLGQHSGTIEQVRRDIALVMATATRYGGRTWTYHNLIAPLNSTGPTDEVTAELASPQLDIEEELLGRWLRTAYARSRAAGMSPSVALDVASVEVTGRRAPKLSAETAKALEELEEGLAGS